MPSPPVISPIHPYKLVYDTSDDNDDKFDYEESDDEIEDMTLNEHFDDMNEDERKDVNYLSLYLDNCASGEDIFSLAEIAALKSREKQISERNEMGYYRCKDKHRKLYHDLTKAFAPYITHDMMRMLHHEYDTQKNEALNNSVASYAPKSKTY